MTLLRPAYAAAPWLFVVACAVGSSAPEGGGDPVSDAIPDGASAASSDGGRDGTRTESLPTALGDASTGAAPDGVDGADDAGGADAAREAGASDAASDAGGDAPGVVGVEDAAVLGPPGLLYFFPFDGDARDASGHGNDGTSNALRFIADRAGAPARAAHFDGATTWVSASGALLPLGARERTVTAWVRAASSPPPGSYGNALVSWGSGDCVGQMWGLGDVSDAVLVWTGCNDQQTHSALPRDTWTFVALRFTGPTTVRVWTGTSSVDVTLPLAPSTSASLLWIGAETTTNDSGAIRRYFAGDVDSVRIYGRALGDAEIAEVYALP